MSNKINWFPGHMRKGLRQIEAALRAADFVLELRDARAPLASANPLLEQWPGKPRLIVCNKADLADPAESANWQRYFAASEASVLYLSCNHKDSGGGAERRKLLAALQRHVGGQRTKGPQAPPGRLGVQQQGQWRRAARGLVVGIPNVGKSTLINALLGRRQAKVEDRAGVTRSVKLIRLSSDYSLYDSPGMLWPNLEDQEAAARLAILGCIRQAVLCEEQLLGFAIQELERLYPGLLQRRYQLPAIETIEAIEHEDSLDQVIGILGRRLQCLRAGGKIDRERLLSRLLRDCQRGALGRLSLERAADMASARKDDVAVGKGQHTVLAVGLHGL